ncbi:MAG: hypothetical protein HKM94_09165 [Halobacteria archaeon]|nr:hypothetical protein [Halobacteria archaeon]
MVVKKYFLQSLALAFVLGLGCAQASEIFVSNRVVAAPVVAGDPALISITLSNGTGGPIRNVDLRLAGAEMMIGGNGVVQLGTVDANGIGTVLAELIPTTDDGSLPTSIFWRVDYDDVVAGNHQQLKLGSELSTEE